ncbi:MAG TPA: P-loop NTPase [Solirubrobacterales bacterium]|nr:P-loop NTPase [Solirubrobacterales bacterium]
MERTSPLRLIWASKLWLALFAVVAAAVVYGVSSLQSDEYESEALGQIVSTSQAEGEILTEEQLLSLSNLYEALAKTSSVLNLAHKDPAVKGREAEFNAAVKVQPEARVGVLGFVATTGDPETSAEFANAYANAFSGYLDRVQVEQRKQSLVGVQRQIDEINEELAEIPSGDPRGAGLEVERQALQERVASEAANPGDTMRVIEPAVPHGSPVAPKPVRNALLALIGALALGAAVIYLRDLLFDRYRSPEEAARDLGLPLLGEIPRGRRGPALEAFRTLRTGMMLSLEQTVRARGNGAGSHAGAGVTLLVTGAESGCGKSYVATNIARTLAAEGRRVAAIDADLRRPSLDQTFSVPLSPGLSDLLANENTVSATELAVRVEGSSAAADGELQVLPAGRRAEVAVERLSSDKMAAVVEEFRKSNDAIVFDSPPTLVVVDPVVLARFADGILFVVDSHKTRRRDARRAVETLRAMGAPLLGFAYNRSERRISSYDAYRPRELRRQQWQPKETKV